MSVIDTFRDVLIINQTGSDTVLVTAVDSCGAIGSKPQDIVRTDPETAALHTARVALLEVASVGARPLFATLSVCNESETADMLLRGVKRVLGDDTVPVVMSTEKNMPTVMSAFGITVTGCCKREELRIAQMKSGDRLFCAGLPLMGNEMLRDGAPFLKPGHLYALLKNPAVHAVIPCGSGGIAHEARVLAAEGALTAVIHQDTGIDLHKSAGPASCAVFAADLPVDCCFGLNIPVNCIGRLV